MTSTQAGIGNNANVTLLSVTSDLKPVPVGNGVTIINSDIVPINLSTDDPPTPANTVVVPPNGASRPIPSGRSVFIWVVSGSAVVELIPGLFNVFNPNVLTNNPPPEVVFGPLSVPDNIAIPIPVSVNTRTLIITAKPVNPATIASISVVGAKTGNAYYSPEIPYLGALTGETPMIIVPFLTAALEEEVIITVATSDASDPTLTVQTDSSEYDESVFYNGVLQADAVTLSGAGSATLIGGPVRLLTLSGYATGAGVAVNKNGTSILAYPTNGDSVTNITFPENTILSIGDTLTLDSSGSSCGADITYAYP